MTTIFLANIIGWYFVIIGLYLVLKHDQLKPAVKELLKNPGVFFLMATVTLILGLLLVASHNIWVMGWPVIITLIAWITLIKGLIRLFFPSVVHNIAKNMLENAMLMKIMGLIVLIIGLFLLYKVYSVFYF